MSGDPEAIHRWLEGSNPGHYRQLALYLQVLREVLPRSVDLAIHHLVTQLQPGRYARLDPDQRALFHRRVVDLVGRCCSLLTVEQLTSLAARIARDRQREQRRRQRRLLERLQASDPDEDEPGGDLPDGAEADPAEEAAAPSPLFSWGFEAADDPLPPGSVRLGMAPPLRGDRLGWFEGPAHDPERHQGAGEPLREEGEDDLADLFAAAGLDDLDQDHQGPADSSRDEGVFGAGGHHASLSDALSDAFSDAFRDVDGLAGSDADSLDDSTADSLDDSTAASHADSDADDSPDFSSAFDSSFNAAFNDAFREGFRDGSSEAFSEAFSTGDRTDAPDPADDEADGRSPDGAPAGAGSAAIEGAMAAWALLRRSGDSGPGERSGSIGPDDDDERPDAEVEDASAWLPGSSAGGLLPRDPLALLAWLELHQLALDRRLRNLSHALNVELLRAGLLQALLPASLLDAVLEGRIDPQGAPPNLLRLQLPMALPDLESPLQVTVLLLRCGDLELEQPRLRTVRRELQRRRQESRRMAQHYRRLQRRLQAREAEALWLQDIRQRGPGPATPGPAMPGQP